jgi:hypothetical protein
MLRIATRWSSAIGNRERTHVVSWLREREAMEVGMESTAQHGNPVGLDREPHFPKLGGRKHD